MKQNNKFNLNPCSDNCESCKPSNEIVLPDRPLRYACCGNCRFYDGDSWCGLHRCSTTGGDRCPSWED